MSIEEQKGLALEKLYMELYSQKEESGWGRKLTSAGYMKYRNNYQGTLVPQVKTHDCTAIECLGTYVDGFIGYLMPQDDDWFKLMPRVKFNGSARDKEYGGFGPLLDEDGAMTLMDFLTDTALVEFSDACLYEPVKHMYKDSEVFGNGYIYVDDNPNGGCVYREVDPQECVIAENDRREVDVFIRHFMMSPIDLVRKYPDAKLEQCWQRVRAGSDAETANIQVYEGILPRDYLYNPNTGEPFEINGGDGRKVAHLVWVSDEHEVVHEGSFNEMPVFSFSPSKDSDRTPYGNGMVSTYIEEIVLLDKMQNLKHVQFEKNVNPPVLIHQALEGRYSAKAGTQVYTGDMTAQRVEPIFKEGASNNYSAMVTDIQEQKEHIRTLFNADLFRTLMGNTDSRKTAYEVSELKNEAVTLLSMKVGNFCKRILEPIVKRTLKIKVRKGEIELPNGMNKEVACSFIDTCSVMLNSVFVRRLQGYLRYQGLVAGLQFMGAYAQLEQFQCKDVLNADAMLRAGLYGAGFPAYAIKDSGELKKERKQQAQMQQQMAQAQMNEQNAKAYSNLGRGMQSMNSAGVDQGQLSQAIGALQ